ncbi:hypothetical protein BB347_15485 [Natronorubrum daqingense]|uniref:Uncharacterized protein n=1 Tax=Natronorubrum daqingense TaxID=588898 RepID=A0A1P8RH07_9EURY|nr:hypothetical protein BB347_15485 [Natronorubrum daqingense]
MLDFARWKSSEQRQRGLILITQGYEFPKKRVQKMRAIGLLDYRTEQQRLLIDGWKSGSSTTCMKGQISYGSHALGTLIRQVLSGKC